VGSIEHIVQDAGTPGIEDFARRLGACFYQNGKKAASAQCAVDGQLSEGYSLTIYSEKDAGMYDAINKGLRRSTGDICAYLNCDEQYLPGTLGWVADYFSHSTETEVLFGAAIITRADGSYVCDRRVMVPTRWHTMVSGNLSIFTSSTFFRRKSVIERGLLFDPQWRVCGDAVWALRFLEAGLRMEATHKPLSSFAETGVNMSASGNPRAADESRLLALTAPTAARAFKPAVLLDYRFRRWLSGAYALKPHSYAVYTAGEADRRQRFDVDRPSFRWQMGAG
jgi:glycosyltransferase involved in cell wall biosynthesis